MRITTLLPHPALRPHVVRYISIEADLPVPFEQRVGLPVQAHARIVRFLSTRAYLDRHPAVPWGDVVFRFGYVDQSHLIRDFQRYYGEPPSVFRAQQHEARLITLVGRDPDTVHGGPVEPLDPRGAPSGSGPNPPGAR